LLSSDGQAKDEDLNAYRRHVDTPRLFRLDRIVSARMTGEHFEDRHRLEPKTGYEDIDARGYAAWRAVVRFSPAVARWIEERPELDLREQREDGSADFEDGSADYTIYYTDPGWCGGMLPSRPQAHCLRGQHEGD
jgi:proteasome accessory factor C